MKKILLCLLSVLFSFSLLAAGCSCGSGANGKMARSIELGLSSCELTVGETKVLPVYIIGGDKSETIWVSSDESVVMVKDGILTAISVGTATITAKFSETADICNVTVIGSESYPTVTASETLVNVLLNTSYPIFAEYRINGKAEEMPLFWKSSDENVATVDPDGVITATGEGTATITVYTENMLASRTITVNVVGGHIFSVDQKNIELEYKKINSGDKTSAILTYNSMLFDNIADGDVIWSSENERVATVSPSGEVVSVGVGETVIKGEFVFSDGFVSTSETYVMVSKSVCFSDVGDLGVSSDNFSIRTFDLEKFKDGTFTVKYKGTVMPSEKSDTELTIFIDALKSLPIGKTESFDIEFDDRIIRCNAFLVTDVITTAEQLLAFSNKTDGECKTGYYVLGNDIELNNKKPDAPYVNNGGQFVDLGFSGTFDGRGYTISGGIYETCGGLFGQVSKDGIIKNFNIENAEWGFVPSDGTLKNIICWSISGTMKNVSITATYNSEDEGVHNIANVIYCSNSATIEDVNIKVTNTSSKQSRLYAFCYWNRTNNGPSSFTNVYVYAKGNVKTEFAAGGDGVNGITYFSDSKIIIENGGENSFDMSLSGKASFETIDNDGVKVYKMTIEIGYVPWTNRANILGGSGVPTAKSYMDGKYLIMNFKYTEIAGAVFRPDNNYVYFDLTQEVYGAITRNGHTVNIQDYVLVYDKNGNQVTSGGITVNEWYTLVFDGTKMFSVNGNGYMSYCMGDDAIAHNRNGVLINNFDVTNSATYFSNICIMTADPYKN